MWSESVAATPKQIGVIPIGLKLATFEFLKPATGKTFKIQNLKSKIQNGISIAQSNSDILNLEPSKPLERVLNSNETHNYQITLQTGQYLHVIVEQKDIDVEVILYSPDGKQLTISNSFNGASGPEPISVIAPASGNYQLKVRRFEEPENPDTGRYEVRVEALRTPTQQDQKRFAAERVFMEANQLALQPGEDSQRLAIAKWQEALALYNAIANSPNSDIDARAQVASILSVIANTYGNLHDGAQAINYFNQALPIYRDLGDSKAADDIRKTLQSLYVITFPESRDAMIRESEGLEILRQGTAESLSRQAIQKFEEARLLYKKVGNKAREANTLRTLSVLYFELKDFQTALQYLNQSLLLLQELRDTAEQAEILYTIAAIYTETNIKDFQKALDYYNQSLQLSRKVAHKIQEAKTLNSLGLVYFYLGNKPTALNYFKQSLPVSKEVDTETEAQALYHIAFVKRDLGSFTEALTDMETALELIEEIRSSIISERVRTSFLSSKQDYYKLYIDLLMQLHKKSPHGGYDAKALHASERARARSLLDLLTEANTDIRQGVDSELLKKERTLHQKLNELEQNRVQLLNSQYTNKQLTELTQQIAFLVRDLDRVKAELRVTSPRYANLKYPEPLTLQQIQEQVLDDNTLLLEYSLGNERSYLWAVTKTSITSYELPKRADIEAAAKAFYNQLKTEQMGSPEVGMKLSQMLLAPVASQLGQKRLLIVSDGQLQSIPFAALPIPENNQASLLPTSRQEIHLLAHSPSRLKTTQNLINSPLKRTLAMSQGFKPLTDENSYSPLLLQHEIVSLPSASTIAVLRRELKGRTPAPKTLAVIADPIFTREDDRILSSQPQPNNTTTIPSEVKRSALDIGVALDRLKYTRTEAQQILALVPDASGRKQAFDFAASRATATSPELAQYRTIHFATHGLLNTVHPELSGLVLSLVDEKGADTDGFLRLHDIFNLNLPAELIVLSACQTGLVGLDEQGEIQQEVKGEGLMGLTRGFMYAGAKRVVVSLWSVKDVATAELMHKFYQQMLRKGVNPVAALRAAQLEMWKTQAWKAPYYWAAFVVQGEWQSE
ncbi:MAG TPA: hypothetical protein DCP31_40880 [Cyanobacteria bacterium UBA8543]|nr:hypothetical protein [Cyanobacteria bacterium UBA8543]